MRAVDPGDLAEERAVVLVDHHHAILPADEQPMIRRIGHDVVPAAVAADRKRMSHSGNLVSFGEQFRPTEQEEADDKSWWRLRSDAEIKSVGTIANLRSPQFYAPKCDG